MSWLSEPSDEARSRWVGEFSVSERLLSRLSQDPDPTARSVEWREPAVRVRQLLEPDELAAVIGELEQQEWVPVGRDGILSHYREGDPIGSWRATAHSPQLAEAIYERAAPAIGAIDGWKPLGVSPLHRFIRYRDGGLLIPHYDAPFEFSPDQVSKLSLIVYLEQSGSGGETRFLHDPTRGLEESERDYSDWERVARPDEISVSFSARGGDALLFPHRLLHDSAAVRGQKTILRTDVVYQRQESCWG